VPIDLTKKTEPRKIGLGSSPHDDEEHEPTPRDKIKSGLRDNDLDGGGRERIKELADFKNRPKQDWGNNPQAPWR